MEKSITGFVRIASHVTGEGRRVADAIDVIWATTGYNGEEESARYDPDDITGIITAAKNRTSLFERQVPVICMTDCMYDLTLSWKNLTARYQITPIAKSSSEVYSLQLYGRGSGKLEAIIFDMRHIMPRGVAGMSDVTGIERDGTPLTDCRIMKAYARELTERYDLYDPEAGDMLGTRIQTLTSIARHQVKEDISELSYDRISRGKTLARTLGDDYRMDASREAARDYDSYAMRRACMRGGFSYVAAREANQVQGRTISIDETSAYHAHAICHYIPEGFTKKPQAWLQAAAERIVAKTTWAVLQAYHLPFSRYLHAEVEFTNIRLKAGTVFERQEIGLEATARLYDTSGVEGIDNESMVIAEKGIRDQGYRDRAENPVLCFAKVMEAKTLTTWVTEQELWCMAQVYEWDSMTVLRGEAATKSKRPDDMAILTSMKFWSEKQSLKAAIESEEDQERKRYLKVVYGSETKPKFNAIGYGIHARDEYRPNWIINEQGEWRLDDPITPETFDERKPKHPRAWFTYGMRIAGAARMHLIIAMQLIWAAFGDNARIVAGDTDSIKVATSEPISEIMDALAPLHDATRAAIDRVTERAARMWPDYYDPMAGVGEFVTEEESEHFYTAGPKQYITIDRDGAVSLTCAGIPQYGTHSYGAWLKLMIDEYGPAVLERVFTFGVTLSPAVSQLTDIDITAARQVGQLPTRTPVEYTLNETTKPENAATIVWQRRHGRRLRLNGIARAEWRDAGPVFIYNDGEL